MHMIGVLMRTYVRLRRVKPYNELNPFTKFALGCGLKADPPAA
jgi:hypothetical protein